MTAALSAVFTPVGQSSASLRSSFDAGGGGAVSRSAIARSTKLSDETQQRLSPPVGVGQFDCHGRSASSPPSTTPLSGGRLNHIAPASGRAQSILPLALSTPSPVSRGHAAILASVTCSGARQPSSEHPRQIGVLLFPYRSVRSQDARPAKEIAICILAVSGHWTRELARVRALIQRSRLRARERKRSADCRAGQVQRAAPGTPEGVRGFAPSSCFGRSRPAPREFHRQPRCQLKGFGADGQPLRRGGHELRRTLPTARSSRWGESGRRRSRADLSAGRCSFSPAHADYDGATPHRARQAGRRLVKLDAGNLFLYPSCMPHFGFARGDARRAAPRCNLPQSAERPSPGS